LLAWNGAEIFLDDLLSPRLTRLLDV